MRWNRNATNAWILLLIMHKMFVYVTQLFFKMATEASSIATEIIEETEEVTTSEVSSDAKRKKRSLIWGYFVIHKEDKGTAIRLTCNEVVSRGGNNPQSISTPLIYSSTCKVMAKNTKSFVRKRQPKMKKIN